MDLSTTDCTIETTPIKGCLNNVDIGHVPQLHGESEDPWQMK